MDWSWDIGRVLGVRVRVHYVFVALLALILVSVSLTEGLAEGLLSLLLVAGVFSIVVLHELGHCVVARWEGMEVLDITLLPIGGVARLRDLPSNPASEMRVAIAGPLVNAVLAVALLPVVLATFAGTVIFNTSFTGLGFVGQLYTVNLIMGLFNLIPAFPLDGGRILRALLAMHRDYVWATSTAASVGRVLALGLGLLGLWFNPWLVALAVFIYFAGAQEERAVRMRSAVQRMASQPLIDLGFLEEPRPVAPVNGWTRRRATLQGHDLAEELARALREMHRRP